MIEEFDGVPLLSKEAPISKKTSNKFTILTGVNAVGKSTLISKIANSARASNKYENSAEFMKKISAQRATALEKTKNSLFDNEYIDTKFRKIIALSTSPFDKFFARSNNYLRYTGQKLRDDYEYIGMRGYGLASNSVRLITSSMRGTFERLVKTQDSNRLKKIYHLLGLRSESKFVFRILASISSDGLDEKQLAFSEQIDENVRDLFLSLEILIPEWVLDDKRVKERNEIISALNQFLPMIGELSDKRNIFEIQLDFSGTKLSATSNKSHICKNTLNIISTLWKYEVIGLSNLYLFKEVSGEMSLRDASSGEQCMLVLLLGIAGNIKDNSLILIDEPEISLHPKWQEQFVKFLVDIFSEYKHCQFIIATHSPQIVSNLKDENCFVCSLAKKEVYPASKFAHRSADFQLAELFDAPGNNNEYLTRLAFNLLSAVKKNREVNTEINDSLKHLLELASYLDSKDNVYELIMTVKEVVDFYDKKS